MSHTISLWSGLYSIDAPETKDYTWDELVALLSVHTRPRKKDLAPGFGPYKTRAPWAPCFKHRDGKPRPEAHRCDDCIDVMTLLVFDVDQGSTEQVLACDGRLEQAGLRRHWYSTFSHTETKPSFRLVVPLASPITPDDFLYIRSHFIRTFDVPANVKQCSGSSHFYFLPSCLLAATPVVFTGHGEDYDAAPTLAARMLPTHTIAPPPDLSQWAPPRRPTQPRTDNIAPTVGELRDSLKNKYERLARKPADYSKAVLLGRVLDGVALAPHGERNTSALIVTGIMAYAVPDATLDDLMELFEPCLKATQAEGSSLTAEKVERMFASAMRSKATAREIEREAEERAAAAYQRSLKANGLTDLLAPRKTKPQGTP